MRKLNTQDVFKMARFINKSGLKEDILTLFKKGKEINASSKTKEEKETARNELGQEAVLMLIEKMANEQLENDFYSLLSGIAEKNPEDIEKQSLEATIEMFMNIAKENNLISFFNTASRLQIKK